MSRFGKKLTMVGIWAGIGILIGMQFGGVGSSVAKNSAVLPGWNGISGTPQTGQAAGASAVTGTGAGAVKGGQAYVYVPVAIDPATGAYTVLPGVQTQTAVPNGTEQLPQQEVKDYSTLTPEQILIPEEQNRGVDVLADKTAGLLQQASQKSIRWVVSLFDSVEE
ncbi:MULTISPECIES: hypothetical protein [unclassified Paenibacillus]|uniref:hypothetical protein n=1 Tax=unclassified Paenibacillus TaxID=185978 RepID=UPI0030F7B3F2